MDIYVINPLCFERNALNTFAQVLNIEHVIDLLLYSSLVTPFSKDFVLNSDAIRSSMGDQLPDNFNSLGKEEQSKVWKKSLQSIFKHLVDYIIEDQLYNNESSGNVLVLSNNNATTWYCSSYFINRLYHSKKGTSYQRRTDFITFNFINQEMYRYSTIVKGFELCGTTNKIISDLLMDYGMREKELFRRTYYSKMIDMREHLNKNQSDDISYEYTREELDGMYKEAFNNDNDLEWNVD